MPKEKTTVNAAIQKKIYQLQEYLNKLAPYTTLNSAVLLGNEEKRAAMERWFQLMVDEAIDINAALAYQLGGRIPESYKSSFHELASLGIIENGFTEQIADSAKVRNQMTHDYEKIRYAELIALMKKYFELYKKYTQILVEKFI